VLDLREVLSDFDNAQPPEALRQRVMRDAAEVFATGRGGGKATTNAGKRRRRPVVWAVAGLGAALVLGLLVIAAHSRDADHPRRPAQQTSHRPRVVSGNGVRLTVPSGWRVVRPASDAPVTDPRTLLVAGTAGVHPQSSQCQIGGKYHIPADGAVVIVIGWLSSSAGGGPVTPGRASLDHLTRVRKPVFECYAGRGAAAQVRLRGIDYQVNVMVGDRASSSRIADALRVARSLNSTVGGEATVLPAGPPPRPLDTKVRYQTPSGFTPEVHLSVPAGWYGYATAQGFGVGKRSQAHHTDGQIRVWRIDQPFATTDEAFRKLPGLTITAWKPASLGGHTGLTYAITAPSVIDLFGAWIPNGNTRATLLDFDGATVMINVQPSHDQAGRSQERRIIQSFSFPP
jgi:hypothetical protein